MVLKTPSCLSSSRRGNSPASVTTRPPAKSTVTCCGPSSQKVSCCEQSVAMIVSLLVVARVAPAATCLRREAHFSRTRCENRVKGALQFIIVVFAGGGNLCPADASNQLRHQVLSATEE